MATTMVRLEMAVGVRILFCFSILPVDEMSRSTVTVVGAGMGLTFGAGRGGGVTATMFGCGRGAVCGNGAVCIKGGGAVLVRGRLPLG